MIHNSYSERGKGKSVAIKAEWLLFFKFHDKSVIVINFQLSSTSKYFPCDIALPIVRMSSKLKNLDCLCYFFPHELPEIEVMFRIYAEDKLDL